MKTQGDSLLKSTSSSVIHVNEGGEEKNVDVKQQIFSLEVTNNSKTPNHHYTTSNMSHNKNMLDNPDDCISLQVKHRIEIKKYDNILIFLNPDGL